MIYIDLDGVCADFVGGLESYLQASVDRSKYGLGVSEDRWEKFWTYQDTRPEFWEDLKVFTYGRKLVEALQASVDDKHWAFCTAVGNSYSAASAKHRWCKKHFGVPPSRVITIAEKHLLAKSSRDILVDDTPYQADSFTNAGGIGLLWPQPWNRKGRDPRIIHHLQSDTIKTLMELING